MGKTEVPGVNPVPGPLCPQYARRSGQLDSKGGAPYFTKKKALSVNGCYEIYNNLPFYTSFIEMYALLFHPD
jgi:hypothetical protein